MGKQLVVVLALGVVCGLAADAAWGHYIGVAAGVCVTVMGLVVIVLRRNNQDLRQLENELQIRDSGSVDTTDEDNSEGQL